MTLMTMRERMLAVVQGRPHDRVPFVQYTGLAAPDQEVWERLGRDSMGLLQWTGLHRYTAPHCAWEQETFECEGRRGFRRVLHTPAGDLRDERYIEPTFGTSAASRHFVAEVDDYPILAAYLRDIVVERDTTGFEGVVRGLGNDGLPHVALPRTPYQQLWIEWVSLRDLPVHMAMNPESVAEVFDLLFDIQRRVFRVACDVIAEGAPVPYLNFGDNITAPAIGDRYFREYCVASYLELADLLRERGLDTPIYVHMDGDLKALWGAIAESPVRGLDSFSPPPDNDTSVADAVREWPEMRLCINFPSSVHLADAQTVYDTTRRLLAEGGHTGRLQVQVSENVPPEAWKTSYPAIVEAIADYCNGKGLTWF